MYIIMMEYFTWNFLMKIPSITSSQLESIKIEQHIWIYFLLRKKKSPELNFDFQNETCWFFIIYWKRINFYVLFAFEISLEKCSCKKICCKWNWFFIVLFSGMLYLKYFTRNTVLFFLSYFNYLVTNPYESFFFSQNIWMESWMCIL